MWKQQIDQLGMAALGGLDVTRMRGPYKVPHDCYGIRIGADSEIDQCIVCIGDVSLEYAGRVGQGVNLGSSASSYGTPVSAGAANPKAFKVSVDRPFTGFVPAGTHVMVAPSRVFSAPVTAANGGHAPLAILEFLAHPSEAMWQPQKRAPLDLDLSGIVVQTAFSIYVPVMGRRHLSVDILAGNAGAAGHGVVVSMYGRRQVWDENTQLVVTQEFPTLFIPATTLDTTAGTVVSYEGDTECDWLRIYATLPDAATVTNELLIHVRGED